MLWSVRRRGVDQGRVVANERMIPSILQPAAAIDVGGEEAGANEIGGLPVATIVLRRIGSAAVDAGGELFLGQFNRFPALIGWT